MALPTPSRASNAPQPLGPPLGSPSCLYDPSASEPSGDRDFYLPPPLQGKTPREEKSVSGSQILPGRPPSGVDFHHHRHHHCHGHHCDHHQHHHHHQHHLPQLHLISLHLNLGLYLSYSLDLSTCVSYLVVIDAIEFYW